MVRKAVVIFFFLLFSLSVRSSNTICPGQIYLNKLKERSRFNPNLIKKLCEHVHNNYDLFSDVGFDIFKDFLKELEALHSCAFALLLRDEAHMDEVRKILPEYELLRKIYYSNLQVKARVADPADYEKIFTQAHADNFQKFIEGFANNTLSFHPKHENLYSSQVRALGTFDYELFEYQITSSDKFCTMAALVDKYDDSFDEKIKFSIETKKAKSELFCKFCKFFDYYRSFITKIKCERLELIALLSRAEIMTPHQISIDESVSKLRIMAEDLDELASIEERRQKIGQEALIKAKKKDLGDIEKKKEKKERKGREREKPEPLSPSDEKKSSSKNHSQKKKSLKLLTSSDSLSTSPRIRSPHNSHSKLENADESLIPELKVIPPDVPTVPQSDIQ